VRKINCSFRLVLESDGKPQLSRTFHGRDRREAVQAALAWLKSEGLKKWEKKARAA